MDLPEYSKLDGVALAELVRRRKVTSKELALHCLEAIEKINPNINAVIEFYQDRIERMDDNTIPSGSFAGVPFLLKDIEAHEGGQRQESGSRLMKGFIADNDSSLTERFRKSGLSLLGRTTTPEFALGVCFLTTASSAGHRRGVVEPCSRSKQELPLMLPLAPF